MILQKAETSPSRQVLVGMLTCRSVLSCIAAQWREPGLFASKWENLVGGWAVEHYRQYERAPKGAIEIDFAEWCERDGDADSKRMIDALIVGLSDEYKRLKNVMQPDHLLDVAAELFEKVALSRLGDRVTACVVQGDVKKAREIVESHRKVELGGAAGYDVFSPDADADFERALTFTVEPLVRYDNALDNFFGESLYRGGFVGFMGRQKIGKSYILQDLAWRAIHQGLNVAYFECGDSTKDELNRRIVRRVCQRPLKAYTPTGLQVRYEIPLEMQTNGGRELPEIKCERRRHEEDITVGEALQARREFADRYGETRFKVSCHPANSVSVRGVETILERWGRDGWRPDVVVVDYADILSPITLKYDKRDQINETWIALRALSQKWAALVVTATQTDSDSVDRWLLGRDNFSENFRKYDHVTGMVGINQTDREKEVGVYRLNWVVPYREMDFSETRPVWCAGCLAIAQPLMLSSF